MAQVLERKSNRLRAMGRCGKLEVKKDGASCSRCGQSHPPRHPAYGQQCERCLTYNHFARMRKKRGTVHLVEESPNLRGVVADNCKESGKEAPLLKCHSEETQKNMPVLEDVLRVLKKARVFSLLDVKDGFMHVKLSDRSSFLTIFWGPKVAKDAIWNLVSPRRVPAATPGSLLWN